MVGIVGFGKMGEAIARGLLKRGIEVGTFDVSVDRRDLAVKLGVKVFESNVELVQESYVIFLAVKPQYFNKVCEELEGKVTHCLVVSIMAGVKSQRICRCLGLDRVVRVMPNTPALVGEGALGVSFCGDFTAEEKEKVLELLEVAGVVVEVDESLMDAVTALSGSGPAYVFLFLEALEDAGVNLGLSRDVARLLALQTLKGSVRLFEEKGGLFREYLNMVTSPGGTTIRALKVLEESGFKGLVMDAVEAAERRAKELG